MVKAGPAPGRWPSGGGGRAWGGSGGAGRGRPEPAEGGEVVREGLHAQEARAGPRCQLSFLTCCCVRNRAGRAGGRESARRRPLRGAEPRAGAGGEGAEACVTPPRAPERLALSGAVSVAARCSSSGAFPGRAVLTRLQKQALPGKGVSLPAPLVRPRPPGGPLVTRRETSPPHGPRPPSTPSAPPR